MTSQIDPPGVPPTIEFRALHFTPRLITQKPITTPLHYAAKICLFVSFIGGCSIGLDDGTAPPDVPEGFNLRSMVRPAGTIPSFPLEDEDVNDAGASIASQTMISSITEDGGSDEGFIPFVGQLPMWERWSR
jgi:hypothetical protein